MAVAFSTVAELCLLGLLPGGSAAPVSPALTPIFRTQGDRVEATVGTLVLEAAVANQAELERLATQAANVLPRLEAELGLRAAAPYRIVLLPPASRRSPAEARLDAMAPGWASGYLLAQQRLGALRLDRVERYPYGNALLVLTHEVTHMLLHDALGQRLPIWFEEGVATWQARRWGLRDVLIFSSNLLTGELPRLASLDAYFRASAGRARVAYAAAFDFVSWSASEYGDAAIREIIVGTAGMPFAEAWQEATGVSLAAAEARWRRGSIFVYRWLPIFSGSGTLWLGITTLALVAGVRRRQRTRRLMAGWEAEESAITDDGPVN